MREIHDISPLITNRLAVWPGDTPPTREILLDLARGDAVTLSTLRGTVHLGAHADAPSHYSPAAATIDQRRLDFYLGTCQVVHVVTQRGAVLTPDAILEPIQAERVLIATHTFPDWTAFNTDFAALDPALIDYFHAQNVRLIGVDTPSVDPFESKELPAHHAISRYDMAILEGLVLENVPAGLYEVDGATAQTGEFRREPRARHIEDAFVNQTQAQTGASKRVGHAVDPLTAYRARFPILAHTNYLISNSLGAVPAAVSDHLQSYFDAWATRGVRAWEEGWWTLAAELGDRVAPLIGARPSEVIFQPNVTLAHAVVLSALDFRRARNKIVTDSMHFPSILYLIEQQRRHGADLAIVPSEDGITVDTQRLIDAIDENTAAVSVSHVLFKSSYIHDIAAIADHCRRLDVLTVIDGYQAVGTIPVDVRAMNVDIYIGGCLKWLCGGPGNAFLWIDPSRYNSLEPALTGWMAHQRPFAFAPEMERRADVWRFFHGTPNISGLFAARPGLDIINEIGIESIRAKSLHQTGRLLSLAGQAGYRCTTPLDPARARAPSPSMSKTDTRSRKH